MRRSLDMGNPDWTVRAGSSFNIDSAALQELLAKRTGSSSLTGNSGGDASGTVGACVNVRSSLHLCACNEVAREVLDWQHMVLVLHALR